MDIKDIFLKENGVSNRVFMIQIIVAGIILFSIFNKFFNNSLYIVVVVIVVFVVLNVFVKEYKLSTFDKNKKILEKLVKLQSISYVKLDSMYSDANLIVFLYDNMYMYKMNPNEFRTLISKTNTFLKLKNSFNVKEQKFKGKLLSRCTQLKGELLNHFQNFIYTVPKMKEMYTNLEDLLSIFHKLLDYNLDQMHSVYTIDQINVSTQYVNDYRKNEWAYPINNLNTDLYHIDL